MRGEGRPAADDATERSAVGRCDRREGALTRQGLGSLRTGTGTGDAWHVGRARRSGWGGGGYARPWLQPFPALIVLGENRTPSRSHCAAPASSAPAGGGGAREGCWGTRARQRRGETQRRTQRGKVPSEASTEAHCEPRGPRALWEPGKNGGWGPCPRGPPARARPP